MTWVFYGVTGGWNECKHWRKKFSHLPLSYIPTHLINNRVKTPSYKMAVAIKITALEFLSEWNCSQRGSSGYFQVGDEVNSGIHPVSFSAYHRWCMMYWWYMFKSPIAPLSISLFLEPFLFKTRWLRVTLVIWLSIWLYNPGYMVTLVIWLSIWCCLVTLVCWTFFFFCVCACVCVCVCLSAISQQNYFPSTAFPWMCGALYKLTFTIIL